MDPRSYDVPRLEVLTRARDYGTGDKLVGVYRLHSPTLPGVCGEGGKKCELWIAWCFENSTISCAIYWRKSPRVALWNFFFGYVANLSWFHYTL
ncbi:hypothetical protein CEXT_382381 [Caerostris extrusa]|uniref:Uncharacterized protein n=1 Tax=Caerostris extrusa TaxID=172846 RepID=A0AAV4PKR9_CAEEX|nr:hypothetical protein CEXT_382381 [Caerostris extrusa]